MQTKDVTKLLNIPRERIKYYRRMGVFEPELGGSKGYTTKFTDRDLENLKRLEVLTKAGLTCDDIRLVQAGEISFEEAFKNRQQKIMEDLKRKEAALKLSGVLLEAHVDYDSLPVEALWDAVRREEDAGAVFMEVDYGYSPVPLTRNIRCPHCGSEQELDLEDYLYDESSDPSFSDNDMGPDIVYSFDTEDTLQCEHCGKGIHIEGWIREYPIGAYDSEHIKIEKLKEACK